ncbi:unnamed protein product [Hymenolepis diminuta]|uniref:DUF5737 domain-containing protein n=1 Tax=Hymenolepis diminuta TaxID=6216 RepID=A0A564XX78_HYMDI|nr:unnamed protein product [Hymenolepis diminuta]
MCAAPVRFEEIAYNYGFIPAEPSTSRSYCLVYRLFRECLREPPRLVLIRGNENVIQIKDVSGSVEDREKFIIYSQDITEYYPFNVGSKAVGFLIQAKRRSKTGYWFIVFQRVGQLAAFCSFLYWLINGKILQNGRSLSPHLQSPNRHSSPSNRRPCKTRHRSWPRPQCQSPCYEQYSPKYEEYNGRRESITISAHPSSFIIERVRSKPSSRSPSFNYYESSRPPPYGGRSRSKSRNRHYYK